MSTHPLISLPNTTALVTGGSRGIGRAVALQLARSGSDICLTYLNSARNAREVAEEISQLGRRAVAVKADLSEASDVEAMVDVIDSEFGKLDIVISNAAGGGFHNLMEASLNQFDYSMRVNVRCLMLLAQNAMPLLRSSTQERAKLITISSLGGVRALPQYGLIGAAKGAIESMTRHLAMELGQNGINVNCVCAGTVDTGALSQRVDRDAVLSAMRARSLVGEVDLMPEDVANAVLFLASPLADKVQGHTLVIDQGASIQT